MNGDRTRAIEVCDQMISDLLAMRTFIGAGDEDGLQAANKCFTHMLVNAGHLGGLLTEGLLDVTVSIDAKPARPILRPMP